MRLKSPLSIRAPVLNRLSLLCCLVLFAGCASSPSYGDHRPAHPALARAYDLGSEHAAVRYCVSTVGYPALKDNWESAQLIISSYPLQWQSAAQQAFNAGVIEGGGFSSPHRVPCAELQALLNPTLVRNYQDGATNLRNGRAEPKHSGLSQVR